MNPSLATGRPWLDLAFQLVGIIFGLVPALLALRLLGREGKRILPLRSPLLAELASAALPAAIIGVPGLLLFYFCGHSRAFSLGSAERFLGRDCRRRQCAYGHCLRRVFPASQEASAVHIAHALLDSAAFSGYALLHGQGILTYFARLG